MNKNILLAFTLMIVAIVAVGIVSAADSSAVNEVDGAVYGGNIIDIDDLKCYDSVYQEYLTYNMLRNYLDKEIYKNQKQYKYKIGDISK